MGKVRQTTVRNQWCRVTAYIEHDRTVTIVDRESQKEYTATLDPDECRQLGEWLLKAADQLEGQ